MISDKLRSTAINFKMSFWTSKSLKEFPEKLTTKTGLQEKDFDVTKYLRQVKLHYDHLYQIVHDLAQKYERCTCNYRPALIRYIELKWMVDESISRYHEKFESVYDSLETTTGTQALIRKNNEINTIEADIGSLHKIELKSDISKKTRETERLQEQTKRLQSAVEKLQREYNISRTSGPITRYRLLKDMIVKTIDELRKCHNPMYELQLVEDDRSRDLACDQPFFYLRSASF